MAVVLCSEKDARRWLRELKAGPPRHPQNSGNDERLAASKDWMAKHLCSYVRR